MILCRPFSSGMSEPTSAAPIDTLDSIKKKRSDFYNNRACADGPLLIGSRNQFARCTRQIATLKKSGVEFYTSSFCKVRALIVGQNPFSQSKNLPGTGETQLIPTGEIDQKIDQLVTTDHLVWPNEQRRAVWLLPNWLPNPTALALNYPCPLTLRSRERLLGITSKSKIYDAVSQRNQNQKSVEVPK